MGSQLNTSVPTRLVGAKNTTAEKLLVAASELMIERSSIEVSLSDIAQKSGVNAALVKYHFGNKDGLLLALLARDAETEVSNLEYLLGQPITPTAKLLCFDGCPLTENAVRQLAMRSLALGNQYSIALAFRSGKRLIALRPVPPSLTLDRAPFGIEVVQVGCTSRAVHRALDPPAVVPRFDNARA